MINWTIGSHFTNYVIEKMNLKTIITSKKFLKKVKADLGNALDILMFTEDMKAKLSTFDKLVGAWTSAQSVKTILESLGADKIDRDDTAVILFTSGSTGHPKGVPLTHRNIMANQKSSMCNLDIRSSDAFLVPLPCFHVFGFMVSLLGILLGARTIFYPDPLDAQGLKKEITKWAASVIFFAPTFYRHLISVSQYIHLKSLRIFISGAEKAPEDLKRYVTNMGAQFLEGYGLTETSPIIAVQSVYDDIKGVGVGKVLEGIDLLIVNPQTLESRDKEQIGEILVAGESVFSGYYQSTLNPFVEIDGRSYFRTGDLGRVDDNGFLILTGRSKRCIKKGGEMVSLVAIEEALLKGAKKQGIVDEKEVASPFAIATVENSSGIQRIILFSEIDIAVDKANKMIIEMGFSRLFKVNEVKKIDQIPVLGSGKVSYGALDELLGKKLEYS